jgi:hypothetical protein
LTILLPVFVAIISFILPAALLASLALPFLYFLMLHAIPMYVQAVLDPLAAILLIRSYRRVSSEIVHRLLCPHSSPPSSTTSVVVANGGKNVAVTR